MTHPDLPPYLHTPIGPAFLTLTANRRGKWMGGYFVFTDPDNHMVGTDIVSEDNDTMEAALEAVWELFQDSKKNQTEPPTNT